MALTQFVTWLALSSKFCLCADSGRQHSSCTAADSVIQSAGHLQHALPAVSPAGLLRLSRHHEARAPAPQPGQNHISASAGGSAAARFHSWSVPLPAFVQHKHIHLQRLDWVL